MKILLSGEDIKQIIPQREPMMLIDTLFHSDNEKTVSGLTILSNNVFLDEGILSDAGIIENMAQTCAARAGYEALISGTPVRIGFIGAIKDLQIAFRPAQGSTIITEVVPKNKIGDVSIMETFAFCNENLAARCEIKIFLM